MRAEDKVQHLQKEKNCSRASFAVLLVLAGGLLLGFNLGLIPEQYHGIFISWQMLLIALGLVSFCRKQFVGGLMLLAVGVFFILPVVGSAFPDTFNGAFTDIHSYWPVLLIVGGLMLIFKKKNRNLKYEKFDQYSDQAYSGNSNQASAEVKDYPNEADYVRKDVLFSSSKQIVFSSGFKGGDANVMFGELILDLRKVEEVLPDNLLRVNAMFGSAIIYIPLHWELDIKSSILFADVKDNRDTSVADARANRFALHVKASCLVGSIEIRN